jgi:hypothetical protein
VHVHSRALPQVAVRYRRSSYSVAGPGMTVADSTMTWYG